MEQAKGIKTVQLKSAFNAPDTRSALTKRKQLEGQKIESRMNYDKSSCAQQLLMLR